MDECLGCAFVPLCVHVYVCISVGVYVCILVCVYVYMLRWVDTCSDFSELSSEHTPILAIHMFTFAIVAQLDDRAWSHCGLSNQRTHSGMTSSHAM